MELTRHEEFPAGIAVCLVVSLANYHLSRLRFFGCGILGPELHRHLSCPDHPEFSEEPAGMGERSDQTYSSREDRPAAKRVGSTNEAERSPGPATTKQGKRS